MKNLIGIFLLVLLMSSCDQKGIPVKKSRTGICHKEGSRYYDQTKYYKEYMTIQDCIKSGGRLPRRR